MNEIQLFEPLHGQGRVREYVDPAAAYLLERLGAITCVKQIQLQVERLGDLPEQIGVGPDQALGVLRISP